MDGHGYPSHGYSTYDAPGYSYNAPRTNFAPTFSDSNVRRKPSVSFDAVPSTAEYYAQKPEPLEGYNRTAETGRPRFSPMSAQYWSQNQPTNIRGYSDYNNSGRSDFNHTNGYSDYNNNGRSNFNHINGYRDYNNNGRSDFNHIRSENFVDPYNKFGGSSSADPTMITSGGWGRPSAATWATRPNGTNICTEGKNIGATTDILKEAKKPAVIAGAAFEYLKNSDRPTVAAAAAFDYLKDGGSNEGAKRYGKFNLAPRHYTER